VDNNDFVRAIEWLRAGPNARRWLFDQWDPNHPNDNVWQEIDAIAIEPDSSSDWPEPAPRATY